MLLPDNGNEIYLCSLIVQVNNTDCQITDIEFECAYILIKLSLYRSISGCQ